MVDANRIEGAVREAGGRVRDAAGALTGDADMQATGQADQLAGKAQRAVGAFADGVRDVVSDGLSGGTKFSPGALMLTGVIGFVLGMMVTR